MTFPILSVGMAPVEMDGANTGGCCEKEGAIEALPAGTIATVTFCSG
jgi:hypothetical protein